MSEVPLRSHLQGKPQSVLRLYRKFASLVEECGPVTYRVTKTAITFKGTKRMFAGAKLTDSSLDGFLDLSRAVSDSRIRSTARHASRVFVNHFRITEDSQMDKEFMSWIQEAYRVGSGQVPTLDSKTKTEENPTTS